MTIDDDIAISPILPTHPRQSNGVNQVTWRRGGHGGAPLPQDDSAEIGLSQGKQAAELLYSASMDQIAQLAGLTLDAGLRQEADLPGISHSQHLLLGIVMLQERYQRRQQALGADAACRAFAPLAREGLARGLDEACQVLRQVHALTPSTEAQLHGLHQLTVRLLDERYAPA
ncbi:DUF5610 domain-containing protein [Chromobacterium paludis]|uniref:DUF5610 domain-containing protein n=1 Tax=Chromobacterium paludis TaxID=2605945 RepID=A0A5C1DFQ2_9NEIS|nr:DUF5610 domain-containing protein [Chromobacterium paludis]QEL54809.1 hypothetical protein FYK34_04125 [Chromobacterium paludis]